MTGARRADRRLFCFGCGYSARVLAKRLPGTEWQVAGTTRESDGLDALAACGIDGHVMSRAEPLKQPEQAFAGTTHILTSVPPDEHGDPVLDLHAADIAAIEGLAWIGYLSTTGVYGDRDGAWVDESAVTAPTGVRGLRRVAAERAWLALGKRCGVPVFVFRLAGIYGPGRNALATVRGGKARRIRLPGHAFTRIHVSDIAESVMAGIARPERGGLYNVCDDEPAPAADVITHACRLLGVAPPALISMDDADLSPMARSFYRDNRRVSNRRLRETLGVALRYPDYRAGLQALFDETAY